MNLRLSLALLAATAISITAMGRDASDFFVQVPQSVFRLLPKNTHMDMVDFFNSGGDHALSNALKGSSKITAMTPAVVTVELTPSSQAQVAVLNIGKADTVIMIVNTVEAGGKDSKLTYFTPQWKKIDGGKYFTMPTLDKWLSPQGKGKAGEIQAQVPFMLMSVELAPDGQTLTVSNSLDTFLDKDVYAQIKPLMVKQLIYKWNGQKFQPVP